MAPSLAASDASACATLPLVGKTMYQALELASELLTPANKAANRSCVVVSSGTGGTGTVGVQLAKALGARETAFSRARFELQTTPPPPSLPLPRERARELWSSRVVESTFEDALSPARSLSLS